MRLLYQILASPDSPPSPDAEPSFAELPEEFEGQNDAGYVSIKTEPEEPPAANDDIAAADDAATDDEAQLEDPPFDWEAYEATGVDPAVAPPDVPEQPPEPQPLHLFPAAVSTAMQVLCMLCMFSCGLPRCRPPAHKLLVVS